MTPGDTSEAWVRQAGTHLRTNQVSPGVHWLAQQVPRDMPQERRGAVLEGYQHPYREARKRGQERASAESDSTRADAAWSCACEPSDDMRDENAGAKSMTACTFGPRGKLGSLKPSGE